MTDDVIQRIHLGDGVLYRDPDARYAILRAVLRFGEHRRFRFTERPLRARSGLRIDRRCEAASPARGVRQKNQH